MTNKGKMAIAKRVKWMYNVLKIHFGAAMKSADPV